MRSFIIAGIMVVLMQSAGAADDPAARTDPMAAPNAERSAESEALMNLQEFAEKLQEAGYKSVEILPQVVVLRAKDKSGKPITMMFDTIDMVATVFNRPSEPETTGSGSPSGD